MLHICRGVALYCSCRCLCGSCRGLNGLAEPHLNPELTAIAGQAAPWRRPQPASEVVAKSLRGSQHAARFFGRSRLFRRS
jgi:hypothetical protein